MTLSSCHKTGTEDILIEKVQSDTRLRVVYLTSEFANCTKYTLSDR